MPTRLDATLEEAIGNHAAQLLKRTQERSDCRADDIVVQAAIEYLARRVDDTSVTPESISRAREVTLSDLLRRLPAIRIASRFRAYVGEWIRGGKLWRPDPLDLDLQAFPTRGDPDPSPPQRNGNASNAVDPSNREYVARIRSVKNDIWTGTAGLRSYYDKDSSPD
jgi:hypothetical protein